MSNDITKTSSTMLVTSNTFIEKLKKYADATSLEFDDYQKSCVANGIRAIDPMLSRQGLTWNDLEVNNVFNVLQQVAFLRLNPSASEIAFQVRNEKRPTGNIKVLEAQIQGNGNDTILRNFGVDVQDVKSYEVYEGDDFVGVEYDGWEVKLPKYTPRYKSDKVTHSVYLIRKKNGEIEVSVAEREAVKVSLLANAKQNGASEELLRELNQLTLDEILDNPKWLDYKIVKESSKKDAKGNWVKESYSTPLFNPSYTGSISKERMLARKLRNHAIRRYPKNFDDTLVGEIYRSTFEDEKYEKQVIEASETLAIEQQVFDEKANKEVLKPKKETIKKTVAKGEEFVVKKVEEQTTHIINNVDSTTGEIVEEEEVVVEDVIIEEEVVEDKVIEVTKPIVSDEEDWMK